MHSTNTLLTTPAITRIPCTWQNDHIVASLGSSRVLVDTGSPLTLSPSGMLDLGPLGHCDCARMPDAVREDLATHVGSLDGLLGTDLLARYASVEFRMAEGEMILASEALPALSNSEVLAMASLEGVPVLQGIGLNGHRHNAIFDTGAVISYFPPPVLSNCADAEPFNDFYSPLQAQRTFVVSETYSVPVRWGELEFAARAGATPEFLAAINEPILGVDALRNAVLRLSYAEQRAYLAL